MKGILAKPMPKHWYDETAAAASGDPIDARICASKKPYFMIYRYPELRSRYMAFQKLAGRKHKITYDADINVAPDENFTEWYNKLCPVQYGRGVVNRICATCEEYFAKTSWRDSTERFDPSILKTGVDYSRYAKEQITRLHVEYIERLQELNVISSPDELQLRKQFLRQDFLEQCVMISPSEIELCDIIVDICYSKEKSKQFAWDMCGEQMVANVLRNSGGDIWWPRATTKGDVTFDGKPFKLEKLTVNEVDNDERYYFERNCESGESACR